MSSAECLKKVGVFSVEKKTLPSLPCHLNHRDPQCNIFQRISRVLIGIPLSDNFEINIFFSNRLIKMFNIVKCFMILQEECLVFPKRNHLFIHSTKIHQAPIICQTFQVLGIQWIFLIFWRILCETTWTSCYSSNLHCAPLSLGFLLCCQPRGSITNLHSNIISSTNFFWL